MRGGVSVVSAPLRVFGGVGGELCARPGTTPQGGDHGARRRMHWRLCGGDRGLTRDEPPSRADPRALLALARDAGLVGLVGRLPREKGLLRDAALCALLGLVGSGELIGAPTAFNDEHPLFGVIGGGLSGGVRFHVRLPEPPALRAER